MTDDARKQLFTMTNTELIAAIQDTWQLTNRTASSSVTYSPAVEHYKALLKEQERRAIERTP